MGRAQLVSRLSGGETLHLQLPPPDEEVIVGINWGRHDQLFTPAYWAAQAWIHDVQLNSRCARLGQTLLEEVAACLLGGHGIPAEVGLAAFAAVKRSGLLNTSEGPSPGEFFEVLSQPLSIRTRTVRYRFAKQRAEYMSGAARALATVEPDCCEALTLRERLLDLKGIGPKTASWIVRNWLRSDDVAIIDVHIYRAGVIAGLFRGVNSITREYPRLEQSFIRFAKALDVRVSVLDALIWSQMKFAGSLGHRCYTRALHSSNRGAIPFAAI